MEFLRGAQQALSVDIILHRCVHRDRPLSAHPKIPRTPAGVIWVAPEKNRSVRCHLWDTIRPGPGTGTGETKLYDTPVWLLAQGAFNEALLMITNDEALRHACVAAR